jgi:hypothetical protein
MKTGKEICEMINTITADNLHVLDCSPASVDINAPRALMQLAATSKLDALYSVLGKKRPKFKCDDWNKINH